MLEFASAIHSGHKKTRLVGISNKAGFEKLAEAVYENSLTVLIPTI